jgi:hypothetical protein
LQPYEEFETLWEVLHKVIITLSVQSYFSQPISVSWDILSKPAYLDKEKTHFATWAWRLQHDKHVEKKKQSI